MKHEDEEEYHDHCRTLFCSSFHWKVEFNPMDGCHPFCFVLNSGMLLNNCNMTLKMTYQWEIRHE